MEQHGDSTSALAEVQKALDACPDLMSARVDRARALIKLERHAEAVKDLEAAVKADPAESSTHFLLAQAYRSLGRTQEAQAEMKVFSKLEESARAKTADAIVKRQRLPCAGRPSIGWRADETRFQFVEIRQREVATLQRPRALRPERVERRELGGRGTSVAGLGTGSRVSPGAGGQRRNCAGRLGLHPASAE